jgi:tetratricopeptide (TPR) repeat protein
MNSILPMKKKSSKSEVLLVYWILVTVFLTSAANASQSGVASDNYNSTSFWLGYAAQQANTITDPNTKDEVYANLSRGLALAGDVNAANVSASAILGSYKRALAHISAAKTFYKQENMPGYKKSMELAKAVALSEKSIESQIFVNGNMISAFLDCNDVNGAKSYAESVKNNSEKQRAYRTIAAYLACNGNIENANAIVNDIIKASGKQNALLEVAETCIRKGNLAVAEQTAERITRVELKDRVYDKLGVAFAERGNIDKARRAAAIISSSMHISSVIAAVAKYQIASGDVDLGKKTTREITYRDYKLAVYTLIVEKEADTGNIDSAVETIETIEKIIDDTPMPADESKFGRFDDSFKKGTAGTLYLNVANALAKKGDTKGYKKYIAKAIDGVKEINVVPALWKGTIFIKIIDAQLKAGDIDGAKITVKEINDEHNYSWGLFNIVNAQLEINDVNGAITTYREIKDTMNKSFACGKIASAFVKKGNIDKAKQILSDLGNSPIEAEAYRQTARVSVETGHAKELASWLEKMPTPQAKVAGCIGAVDGILKTEKNKHPVN